MSSAVALYILGVVRCVTWEAWSYIGRGALKIGELKREGVKPGNKTKKIFQVVMLAGQPGE